MSQPWFQVLINRMADSYSNLIIVHDPDNLGKVKEIMDCLVSTFILYHYKGELWLRDFLRKQKSGRIIIFRPPETDYFPYDLEERADLITWRTKDVFPRLDIDIIKSFGPVYFQDIFNHYSVMEDALKVADARETLRLICGWLWGIDPLAAADIEQAIALFASIYQTDDKIPPALKDLIVSTGKVNLPEDVLQGQQAFYDWLSSQWQSYLDAIGRKEEYWIDFADNDLKNIVSNLFQKSLIVRYKCKRTQNIEDFIGSHPWTQMGIILESSADYQTISRELKEQLCQLLHEANINWTEIAQLWGKLSYLKDEQRTSDPDLTDLDNEISNKFQKFIIGHYKDLFYESYVENPVTIDRVIYYIGNQTGEKKVLVCFDGMGFQEWYCLKRYFTSRGIDKFREGAVYAMLPTLTLTSRRALFSGKKSILELDVLTEDKGFHNHVRFNWQDGKSKDQKMFVNAEAMLKAEYFEYDYIGIIFNLVDDIAHSIKYTSNSKIMMQMNLSYVLEKDTKLAEILTRYLLDGYRIYITADHGSVWCSGNGLHAEKYLVDMKARRALLYSNKALAEDFSQKNNLICYGDPNLLADSFIVVPPGREMFAPKGDSAISHGGIHIEEVVIPFVEVLS